MFYLVEGFDNCDVYYAYLSSTKMIIENNKYRSPWLKFLVIHQRNTKDVCSYTTIVILISTLLSFGITTWILSYAFKIVFEEYAGWLPFLCRRCSVYIKMFIMTVISYLFVMMIQMRKSREIPMDEALKNVE